jgi:hypothetical protein
MRRDLSDVNFHDSPVKGGYSHHCAAAKGHNKHEKPVGDEVHGPHQVTEGNGQAMLGQLAVHGVEPGAGMTVELVLATRGLEGDQGVGGGGGQVESLAVDLDSCRLRKHLENVEAGRASGPGVAENRLVVAVQVSHMRGVVEKRKLGSGLVEGLLNSSASTIAGLVSTRDEQPPLLGSGGVSGNRLVEGLLPVVQSQDVESHGTSLGLGGSNRIMVGWVRNVRSELADDILELGLVLVNGRVLRGSEGGQSRENSRR